eukprot:351927-Pleurochrysis_carterae.AAC.1
MQPHQSHQTRTGKGIGDATQPSTWTDDVQPPVRSRRPHHLRRRSDQRPLRTLARRSQDAGGVHIRSALITGNGSRKRQDH